MERNGPMSGNSFSTFKENIAERLHRAAGSLARQTGEESVFWPCSRQASEWLHHSAEYVKNFDVQRADEQIRNQIRTYPGRSMLVCLAAGILVGLWIRRR